MHVNIMDTRKLEQSKQSGKDLRVSFPAAFYRIDDMIAEGGKVAVRYTIQGTHKVMY
jgi:hypothetical protein